MGYYSMAMKRSQERTKTAAERIFVALSGGVDSSVAALLLKGAGYDITGVFMRCYNLDGCAERDAEDAKRVAQKLGIPFYSWDFEEEYKKRVVDYMVEGYRQGLTPNPDVMCNREIKFGLFFDKARVAGADYVATGHYVIKSEIRNPKSETIIKSQILKNKHVSNLERFNLEFVSNFDIRASNFSLNTAKDGNKDQSYFLWTLTQEKLRHCLFPIGDYLKSEVREIARKAGLPTAEKKDSQGICFLGQVTLADFLAQYIPERNGAVLNLKGEKLGEHSGAHLYTLGQREGIGNIKHQKGMHTHTPLYVAEKDVRTNTIVVAEGDDNPALYKNEIELADTNFLMPDLPSLIRANGGIRVLARVRYRQPLAAATLIYADSTQTNAEKNSPRQSAAASSRKSASFRVLFEKPQKAIAPGQSAVFYLPCRSSAKAGVSRRSDTKAGEENSYEMLGGGVIS